MYPNNNLNNTTCLEGLVAIKSKSVIEQAPFYIEDIQGITIQTLANVASAVNQTGEQFGKDLISSASRILLSDVQMIYQGNYSLIEAFGELCSTCIYLSGYQAGGGVKITNTKVSKYAQIQVLKIEVNCNAVGAQIIVLDDGITQKEFPFTAGGVGVVTPVLIKGYTTNSRVVKVRLKDATVGLAMIDCAKGSGCGCSGKSGINNDTAITYTGTLLGIDTSIQYGFKICANVVCSSDLMLCDLVAQTPNIFGASLLYKVGELFYGNSQVTQRMNIVKLDGEHQKDLAAYYGSLYKERVYGNAKVKGLKVVVGDYLGRNRDNCVSCENPVRISYVKG